MERSRTRLGRVYNLYTVAVAIIVPDRIWQIESKIAAAASVNRSLLFFINTKRMIIMTRKDGQEDLEEVGEI